MIVKETERLILRDIIESDIENRKRWETEETEWKLWDAPWESEAMDPAEAQKELEEYVEMLTERVGKVKSLPESHLRTSLQIVEKASGEPIGWVGVYAIDDDYCFTEEKGKTAIGIDIPEKRVWGMGYGTEALRAAMDYFKEHGLSEIYTQTWSGNMRMIRLAEKLGFTEIDRKVGHRVVRGETYDGLTFVLPLQ